MNKMLISADRTHKKKPISNSGAERTIRRMVGNDVRTAAGPENIDFYRMVCV